MSGRPRQLAISGGTAYVANYGGNSNASSVQTFSISDPLNPFSFSGSTVYASSGFPIYVAANESGVCITSASESTLRVYHLYATSISSRINIGSGPQKPVMNGRIVYVRDSNGTEIFDISNPGNVVLLGRTSSSILAINGNLAFGLAGNELQVYDISSATTPILKGKASTVAGARFIAVAGNTVFVSTGNTGLQANDNTLQVFDINIPSSPTLRGTTAITTNGGIGVMGLAASDNTAYIVDGHSLQIFKYTGAPRTVNINLMAHSVPPFLQPST
ncbi:LVIVD repeat-containing protein [Hymenobacter sp. AT01-02]|uniref:LVIVD repeat-containing protein n=1 Tax=Hymenobacter sp. AT01-02 TaxID=1571877 RepID=UPI000A99FF55|nr:hypothetical protein [Hymenobacter sp. AT01-02]